MCHAGDGKTNIDLGRILALMCWVEVLTMFNSTLGMCNSCNSEVKAEKFMD